MVSFFKKCWEGLKWFGGILLALLAGIGAFLLIKKVRQAIIGKPTNRINWAKSIDRTDQIFLYVDEVPENWEVIDLPTGVTSDEIKNVGTDDSQHNIIVEVDHEKTDRRNSTVIDNNALDNLFPGSRKNNSSSNGK